MIVSNFKLITRKYSFVLLAFIIGNSGLLAQNLLEQFVWQTGTTVPNGYINKGAEDKNVRELGVGPHGSEVVLWKAIPDGQPNTDGGSDGGYDSSYISIDHTKTYRLSVWIKKTNSNDGTTYFGLESRDDNITNSTLYLNDAAIGNPYFWFGDLPVLDKWYLLIGYIHKSSYSSTVKLGGIYDGVTGTKVANTLSDFKFKVGATQLANRAYLYYDPNINDRQYFYAPRIDEINGNEPSMADLIAGTTTDTTNGGTGNGGTNTSSVWNKKTDNIYYNEGNVGIGTSNPDTKLTVKGQIHTEEVIIDLSVPAPDYVFKKEYNLRTIKEVEKYINKYSHLPEIPSAKEFAKNGIKQGEMDMNLLKKVEELTLYTIQQEKQIRAQQQKNAALEARLEKLEVLLKK